MFRGFFCLRRGIRCCFFIVGGVDVVGTQNFRRQFIDAAKIGNSFRFRLTVLPRSSATRLGGDLTLTLQAKRRGTDEPFAVEWLKFDADSEFQDILQKRAHVAYECDDLEEAMKGYKVLVEPFEAGPGLRCAFIEADGYGVELMQRS